MGKIEVLISTMNQVDDTFIKNMNITTDCLIVNQITNGIDVGEESTVYDNVRMLNYYEKGLSKSRNKAIMQSKGDICMLADDDVIYKNDYREIVLNAHEEYPEADIIAFQVIRKGSENKKSFRSKKSWENYLTSLKVSSVEITFKRLSIIENNITFNEDFGAGSEKYFMGEENIFLCNCLKKGLKILYLPIEIGEIQSGESTWFKGFGSKYFIDRGACYYAMSTQLYSILILQFALRKRNIYKGNLGTLKAIKLMFEGARQYRRSVE